MAKEVVGIIPARFKSSRFPGKVLANILGKSLVRRTYENATRCSLLDEIVVAVDDQKVFDHVTSFGGRAVMTDPGFINGTTRAASIISELPEAKTAVVIQADEPLVNPLIIDTLVRDLDAEPQAFMTTPVVEITNPLALLDPSVVKCVFDKNYKALYFSRACIPYKKSSPTIPYFRHSGIYCFRRESLLKYPHLEPTPLSQMEDLEQLRVMEHGFSIYVSLVKYEGVEVNHPEDIKKVEEILCKENTSLLPAV